MFSLITAGRGRLLKVIGGCFLVLYLYNKEWFDHSSQITNNIYLGSETDFALLEKRIEQYQLIEGQQKPESWYEDGLQTLEQLSARQEEYTARLHKTKEHLSAAYNALFSEQQKQQESVTPEATLEEKVQPVRR